MITCIMSSIICLQVFLNYTSYLRPLHRRPRQSAICAGWFAPKREVAPVSTESWEANSVSYGHKQQARSGWKLACTSEIMVPLIITGL